ncbi:MAG: endonuclease/exonuclease/phosphatase family protein [archaeon]
MKKRTLNNLIKLLAFLIILTGGYITYDNYSGDSVKIANWNLQIFGTTKASDLELMNFYADKIDNYDIIFIQEIRDSSETAFTELCSMLEDYSCFSSSRAGRSSSKEQYGVIYKNGINILSFADYNPDKQDRWERPPIKVIFNITGYELAVYNIHTKPDDVQKELYYLENLMEDEENVILLGDLNADCSYYDAEKQTEFDSWNWVIADDEDTTSSSTHCAYDKILLNSDAVQEFKLAGIDSTGITKEISDHYLVWVEMKIN